MTIEQKESLKIMGAMTGNSLDGCDAVLAEFLPDGTIKDIASAWIENPDSLKSKLRHLRHYINQSDGNMESVVKSYRYQENGEDLTFDDINNDYLDIVVRCFETVIQKSGLSHSEIDAVALHGQTCAHLPPSIAGVDNKAYTVQIGDGQELANRLGITTIYDFRSDDVMNGGEGAPLTPMHNEHLAEHTKRLGKFPIAFCNGGNSGNVALITVDTRDGKQITIGWDTGPFNNYIDKLIQFETGESYDKDAAISKIGKVNLSLLIELFEKAVVNKNGENYLLTAPPKSSDPQWYLMIDALKDPNIPFEDRIRTAAYFSAYIFVHSLSLTPSYLQMPKYFAVFGGGWKNTVVLDHFKGLLSGDFENNPVLDQHKDIFKNVINRIGKNPQVEWSSAYGIDPVMMEGRLWADMGRCRLIGRPFTRPSITNVKQDTVAGLVRFPHRDATKATPTIQRLIKQKDFFNWTLDQPNSFDGRWSRASSGWWDKIRA